MSIIKRSRSNFGVVPRKAMEEGEMSLKAKGLLAYLLCMPEDWQIYVSQLAKVHKESKNTIAKIINELIEFGYVIREQRRDGHKFAGYDYTVFDVSQKNVSQKDVSQNLRHVKLGTTNIDSNKEDNKKKDSRVNPSSDHIGMFQEFLEAYGNKQNMVRTQKEWSLLGMMEKEKALAGAKKWRAYYDSEKTTGTKFQKAPNNFLREKLYNEQPPKTIEQAQSNSTNQPLFVYKVNGKTHRHSNEKRFEHHRKVFKNHFELIKNRANGQV